MTTKPAYKYYESGFHTVKNEDKEYTFKRIRIEQHENHTYKATCEYYTSVFIY